jgi:hypothetical protein
MSAESPARPFQVCGSCQNVWPTWESFVTDPAVRLLGLQSVINRQDINLLVFEHSCGSSISIFSRRLHHILPEANGAPVRLLGTDQCRGHCVKVDDFEACDAPCANARDRTLVRFLHQIGQKARESGGS